MLFSISSHFSYPLRHSPVYRYLAEAQLDDAEESKHKRTFPSSSSMVEAVSSEALHIKMRSLPANNADFLSAFHVQGDTFQDVREARSVAHCDLVEQDRPSLWPRWIGLLVLYFVGRFLRNQVSPAVVYDCTTVSIRYI